MKQMMDALLDIQSFIDDKIDDAIQMLLDLSKKAPGYQLNMMIGLNCAAVLCASLAVIFSASLPLAITLGLSTAFLLVIANVVMSLRYDISKELYELAIDLSKEKELTLLVAKDEPEDSIKSNVISIIGRYNAAPYLKVLNDIDDAQSISELNKAKKEFNAIKPWTYWGLFPFKPESAEFRVEQIINEGLSNKKNQFANI